MTENYFTLWNAHMGTVDVLDGRRMQVEPDGSFTITVDSDEAGGRPNHVRSTPEAHEFYIRDVLLDWTLDDPNAFTVERLGGAPAKPALTLDEQAEATARMMAHFADFTGKLSHGMYKLPENHFSLAWSADHSGAMRNQVYVAGRFLLAPDEAFVVDVSDGGADYFTVPLSNIWGTTLDILDRTGSLNKAQSAANEDGTYTFVISAQDPGVHNWIDTDGLHEGILTLRMAEFPDGGARPDLSATGRVVKLDRLDAELPDAPRVSPDERAAQLATRRAGYLRRLPEPAEGWPMSRWLVTGCSTGIGREVARAALEAGHQVVVTSRKVADVSRSLRRLRDRARRTPRRHRPRPDRRRCLGGATTPSAASTCWSTTPATATSRRSRRATTPRCAHSSTPTTSGWSTRSRRCCRACAPRAAATSSTCRR